MAPTATGSKARWAPQTRRKECMGWSWVAACVAYWGGAYRGGLPPTACFSTEAKETLALRAKVDSDSMADSRVGVGEGD